MPDQAVEQATPQGSAESAPPSPAPATTPTPVAGQSQSGGRLAGVPSLHDAISARMQAATLVADEPTPSATDEQPSADAPTAPTGQSDAAEAPAPSSDAGSSVDPAKPPPGLTRKQRREWWATQKAEAAKAGQAEPPAPEGYDEIDELADSVESLRQSIATGLDDLKRQTQPTAQTTPDQQAALDRIRADYIAQFGDDAEFQRRADLKLRGAGGLSIEELDDLEVWANNRVAKQLTERLIQRDITATALTLAQSRGVDVGQISTAPTLHAIFDAFYSAGQSASGSPTEAADLRSELAKAKSDAAAAIAERDRKIEQLTASNTELSTSNQTLSDDLDAARQRAAGAGPSPISGGFASLTVPGNALDAARMTGKEMLRIAAENHARKMGIALGPGRVRR